MPQAVIVSGARTAIAKGARGTLKHTRPEELAAAAIAETVNRTPGIDTSKIDDVVLGCSFPEQEQGMNIGRIAALRGGLPHDVPAVTVNRFCSSGLQTIAQAAHAIIAGDASCVLAGGVESMSYLPFDSSGKITPNPVLADTMPAAYIPMGITAENVAAQYNISREASDAFAYESHMKAIAAIAKGQFADEIFPFNVTGKQADPDGHFVPFNKIFDTDEGPRKETSLEKLATLKPVFKLGGTVTAGNSSQVSDGAAIVMLMSDAEAKKQNLTPLATFKGFAVAGVAPEIMGIGPINAVPKLLENTGINIDDVKLIELNEAFACQSLAVIKTLGLNQNIINVNGGAIALGHPLGCTGAKLTLSLIHELKRRGGGLGIVTMCIGGGMGAAGLFEVH